MQGLAGACKQDSNTAGNVQHAYHACVNVAWSWFWVTVTLLVCKLCWENRAMGRPTQSTRHGSENNSKSNQLVASTVCSPYHFTDLPRLKLGSGSGTMSACRHPERPCHWQTKLLPAYLLDICAGMLHPFIVLSVCSHKVHTPSL